MKNNNQPTNRKDNIKAVNQKVQEKQKKKKNIKYYLYLILVIAIIIIVLGVARDIFDKKANYQKAKQQLQSNEFDNIESDIYYIINQAIEENPQFKEKPTYSKQKIVTDNLLINLGESQIEQENLWDNISDNNHYDLQIAQLQKQYLSLEVKLEKTKSQNNLSKIIITFVELRDLIELGQNYQTKLYKLEILTNNSNLAVKIKKLRLILENKPKSNQQIKEEFVSLIPKIMTRKYEINSSNSLLDKVKNNITKLVVIRKINGIPSNPDQNIDLIIAQAEKLIDKGEYQRALEILKQLEKDYQSIITKTIFDLTSAVRLNQITNEIFSYLKLISSEK